MKKMIMASAALIAFCSVLIVFTRFYISERERDRYNKTVEILNGLTTVSELNLTNVYHDAWGHAMHIDRDVDCWFIVSLGHDPTDSSWTIEEILQDVMGMKWNPRLGQINIDFKYDGQIRSYSINEEHDN